MMSDFSINIVLDIFSGDPQVGKTSVMLRYLRNQFSPMYIPTKKVAIGKYDRLTSAFLLKSRERVGINFLKR